MFNDTLESAWFDRLVLRNNHGPAFLAKDQMGTGLADLNKTETLQSPGSFAASHISRELHEKANTGSSTKWSLMK